MFLRLRVRFRTHVHVPPPRRTARADTGAVAFRVETYSAPPVGAATLPSSVSESGPAPTLPHIRFGSLPRRDVCCPEAGFCSFHHPRFLPEAQDTFFYYFPSAGRTSSKPFSVDMPARQNSSVSSVTGCLFPPSLLKGTWARLKADGSRLWFLQHLRGPRSQHRG